MLFGGLWCGKVWEPLYSSITRSVWNSTSKLFSSRPFSRSQSISKIMLCQRNAKCSPSYVRSAIILPTIWLFLGGCGVFGDPGCFLCAGRTAYRSICHQTGTWPHCSWGQTPTPTFLYAVVLLSFKLTNVRCLPFCRFSTTSAWLFWPFSWWSSSVNFSPIAGSFSSTNLRFLMLW